MSNEKYDERIRKSNVPEQKSWNKFLKRGDETAIPPCISHAGWEHITSYKLPSRPFTLILQLFLSHTSTSESALYDCVSGRRFINLWAFIRPLSHRKNLEVEPNWDSARFYCGCKNKHKKAFFVLCVDTILIVFHLYSSLFWRIKDSYVCV